jgi:hypothetical protein
MMSSNLGVNALHMSSVRPTGACATAVARDSLISKDNCRSAYSTVTAQCTCISRYKQETSAAV